MQLSDRNFLVILVLFLSFTLATCDVSLLFASIMENEKKKIMAGRGREGRISNVRIKTFSLFKLHTTLQSRVAPSPVRPSCLNRKVIHIIAAAAAGCYDRRCNMYHAPK